MALEIDGYQIDLLVIKDLPQKPYYLTQSYKNVRANHIYSRIMDTNTPIDGSASPYDVERMWRERFGLNLSPRQKVQRYICNYHGWQSGELENGNSFWFYRDFPEFTIRVEDAQDYEGINEEWTRGEVVTDKNFCSYYSIYFHQTRLAKIRWASIDDRKMSMVTPDWKPRKTGRFYFYNKDSWQHIMQVFHTNLYNQDFSKNLSRSELEIPVMSNEELSDFLALGQTNATDEVCCDEDQQVVIFKENNSDYLEWKSSN